MLFAGLLLSVGTASAFISPSASRATQATPQSICEIRVRGRLRTNKPPKQSGLFASVTSDQSVNGATKDVIETSTEVSDDTMLYFMSSNNKTSDFSAASLPTTEKYLSFGKTEEQHMQRTRMGDDVEELTHLLAHAEMDLQKILYPSIAISYDSEGMVQADATLFDQDAYAAQANGSLIASSNDSDYPAFIKFLYQKDANGQTVASKVFNFALLAISFCYVFSSVFNIDKGMTRGWTPGEIGMRIPLDTWASYENSLSEKPVATKTIINVVIYLLGDWLSQTLFQGKNVLDFDAGRTIKNGMVGMAFGPAVHEYYEFSDWILPVDGATFGVTNRAFKILMDQTIYLAVKCSIYIIAIGVLNGETVGASTENVKNRLKPIMFTAWKFWPLVHCVTYGLIPARHRILWVNSVDLVWNAILASKARGDGPGDDEKPAHDEKRVNGEAERVEKKGAFDLSQIMKQVAFEIDEQPSNSTASEKVVRK